MSISKNTKISQCVLRNSQENLKFANGLLKYCVLIKKSKCNSSSLLSSADYNEGKYLILYFWTCPMQFSNVRREKGGKRFWGQNQTSKENTEENVQLFFNQFKENLITLQKSNQAQIPSKILAPQPQKIALTLRLRIQNNRNFHFLTMIIKIIRIIMKKNIGSKCKSTERR